jgi:hypothetical protein
MNIRKRTLKIAGAIATAGFGITAYLIFDQRRKDALASSLWQELNKLLNPSTGLASEVAFDVNYVDETARKVKGLIFIKANAALSYAKTIKSAWGLLNDDENKVYSVFRNLKDKVQVSQVAKAYAAEHKINLIEELKDRLSDSELTTIITIVRALPPYRVVS